MHYGHENRTHVLDIDEHRDGKGAHVTFRRPDYVIPPPGTWHDGPTPISGKTVAGGISLDEDQVRALYKLLGEHLGETPASAGTIKINVETDEALAKLDEVARRLEAVLEAEPPTVTVTNHLPEPEEEESALEEVLADAREEAGFEPDDDTTGLVLITDEGHDRLRALLDNPLGAIQDQIDADTGRDDLSIPVISEDGQRAFTRLIEREMAAERRLIETLRAHFKGEEPQDSDGR